VSQTKNLPDGSKQNMKKQTHARINFFTGAPIYSPDDDRRFIPACIGAAALLPEIPRGSVKLSYYKSTKFFFQSQNSTRVKIPKKTFK